MSPNLAVPVFIPQSRTDDVPLNLSALVHRIMNSNVFAGLIIGALVIIGIIALVLYRSPNSPPSSTTTVTTVTSTTTGSESATSTVDLPTLTITTRAATSVGTSTATLHASIAPRSATSTYWFEYSADPLLGAILNRTSDRITLGPSLSTVPVTARVSNLSTNTKYYFRIVVENGANKIKGDSMSFSTK